MGEQTFDTIVMGAGPAGEVAAGRLAERGQRVALVEQELVGGECSYYACMPSKALLRPAELLDEVPRVPGAAEAVTGTLDVAAALRRRDEVIHDLDDSAQLPWLEHRDIALVRGRGRLDGARRVQMDDGEVLMAEKAVIVATGSGPVMPPIPGLAEAAAWTNREATTAKQAPESMVILGGGAVGVEMAQAWSSFGTSVTLVEAMPMLLSREEAFAGAQVGLALRERGVNVRVGARAVSVLRGEEGVSVDLEDGARVTGQELLVAIGRRPHSEDIGLETVGLEPGAPIEVDDHLRVPGREWLYAIGDVNGRVLLTHMGKYQARIAADVIMGRDVRVLAKSDGELSPRVIFTDPQVAAVGLTERSAMEQGLKVRCVDVSTESTAGASFWGRGAGGTSRLVVDERRRVIVGATFSGPEVGEWVYAATVAIVAEVPLERLWHAVPCFPTRSEVWLKLLEGYGL